MEKDNIKNILESVKAQLKEPDQQKRIDIGRKADGMVKLIDGDDCHIGYAYACTIEDNFLLKDGKKLFILEQLESRDGEIEIFRVK